MWIQDAARRWQRMAIALALALTTLAVYARVRHHAFLTYDDTAYLLGNPFVSRGLTWDGFTWAFSTFHESNWHPLTWLSHMLDCQLFGLDPGWHHVVNLVWHVANASLLFVLLERMTGSSWRSALVAALFALHPLHVESVAWVAERKDVQSTFFGLLCIWLYVGWVRKRSISQYALALLSFAFALLSKPMLVTLPFVLLLLDFWPLRRVPGVAPLRLVAEKLPFFAFTLASSVITYIAQHHGGAIVTFEALPMSVRVVNAILSYGDYLTSIVLPVSLAILHPRPEVLPVAPLTASALLLLDLSAIALQLLRQRSFLVVGWLWFLGTLVPVIGLVQVGLQARADRYTYFPSIGLFLMLVWSLPRLNAMRRSRALAVGAASFAVLAVLSWRTHVELGYWQNSVTLFDRAIAVTSRNYVAHLEKGYALEVEQGRLDDAIAEYRQALRIRPDFHPTWSRLADALLANGELAEAVQWYRSILEAVPSRISERHNLAVALARLGRPAEAIPHFAAVVERRPRFREAWIGLGTSFEQLGRTPEAVATYRSAVARLPADAELRALLGRALAKQRSEHR